MKYHLEHLILILIDRKVKVTPFIPLSAAGGFLFEGLSDDEDDFHQVSSQVGQNTSSLGLICKALRLPSSSLPIW